MCDSDNITNGACVPGTLTVPDRSSCHHYYQCQGGIYRRVACSPIAFVYNIDLATCQPDDGTVDCSYRCKTPVPTTEPVTTGLTFTTSSSSPTSGASTFIASGVVIRYYLSHIVEPQSLTLAQYVGLLEEGALWYIHSADVATHAVGTACCQR